MPTIAEPLRAPISAPPLRPQEHLSAILLDLAELGIEPTRLAVLSRALECGVPEQVAVEVAAMNEAMRCAA